MTAQAHDHVMWKGEDFLLVGCDRTLFDPREHGLDTRPTTTANWRGCIVTYEVRNERLMLVKLHDVGLALGPGQEPPSLFGVAAVPEGPFTFTFPDLAHPLEHTTRLLIARGFIQSLYRHMGFHPAWKFEESWELTFDAGRLTKAEDLSEQMRRTRKDIAKGKVEDPDSEERPGWIERTFTLGLWRSRR